MTEQQQHLQNLVNQRQEILKEIESLQVKINSQKELGLKVQGAIEYLDQIGVKLEGETVEKVEDEPLEEVEEKTVEVVE
jgi:prefoldin subunit 5